MKKIIFIIMLIAGIAMAEDGLLWYGNTNAVTITNAMNYLNTSLSLPCTGSKDGVEIPNQTTDWCSAVLQTTNGWYCIPMIPDNRLDALGFSEEDRDAFLVTYDITIITNPVLEAEE